MSEASHPGENMDKTATAGDRSEHYCDSSSIHPEEWSAKTAEREYYQRDGIFIKRNLRPTEFMTTQRGTIYTPRLGKERHQNEAATLRYIRQTTNIPVPTVYGSFELGDSFFIITEYIEGVAMSQLSTNEKEFVYAEINKHLATLRSLISHRTGVIILPYRVMDECRDSDAWSLRAPQDQEYVFCHNDLSQHNKLVHPDTLEIKAIID